MALPSALGLSNFALALMVATLIGAGVLGATRSRAGLAGFGLAVLAAGTAATAGPATAMIGVTTTLTLATGVFALTGITRAALAAGRRALPAALAGLLLALAFTVGPFLLGPALDDLPASAARWLLFANPWVMTASAAGIDVLHLDWIYHLSPLAHRGVALPHWSLACAAYLAFGLVCYGASRLFSQESINR